MPGKCTERNCSAGGEHVCVYIDRYGDGCRTSWCQQHIRLLAGDYFCRRHAGTIAALNRLPTSTGETPPHPPLHNRGASLLRWMLKELDAPMRELLTKNAGAGAIITTGRTYEDRDPAQRAWAWFWQRQGGGVPGVTVIMSVEEEADDYVVVHVDDHMVLREKPPWIGHHQNDETVDPAIDAWERREYEKEIIERVSDALNPQNVA